MPDSDYDVVLYPSYTHPQTHPDRLAVIATLFGLHPSRMQNCRVLELGCGNGNNLVPMAWEFPESQFIGIDLAAKPIAHGQQMVRDLALDNLRLVHGNITEINETWGSFDYIIAHGFYSWVPVEVREHLLAICRQRLAPNGVAFISYNALPGGQLRNMLREMLLFHVRGFESPNERVSQAKAFLRFLADAQDTPDEYRLWMKSEAQRILYHDEGHLYHDELAAINDPLSFTQFIQHAAQHGLQFLGEADYFDMSDHYFKNSVRETLSQLSGNRIAREQYLDFLKCRRFRQTLLCHHEIKLQPAAQPEKIASLLISSNVASKNRPPDLRPGVNVVFENAKGAKLETDFPLGKAALFVLEENSPAPMPFELLLAAAMSRLTDAGIVEINDPTRVALCEFLLRLYASGTVELRTSSPTLARQTSVRPVASPVARWQVQRGNLVTSLFHIAVKIEDEIGRCLLSSLDGHHDRAALTEKIWQLLKSKNALIISDGDEATARRKIESDLESNLEKLAKIGLLVS